MIEQKNKEKIITSVGWCALFLIILGVLFLLTPQTQRPQNLVQIEKLPSSSPIKQGFPHLTPEKLDQPIQMIVFFASWCSMCAIEHPNIVSLKKRFPQLQIHGISVNDQPSSTLTFLEKNQNPYDSLSQASSEMLNTFNAYGVPQNFLITDGLKIVYQHMGVLKEEQINQNIVPLIRKHLQDN